MTKKGKTALAGAARVRKVTKRQQKKLDKKQTRIHSKLPNSFRLTGQVFRIFRSNWQKLLGIVIVYLALNIVFASGFGKISTSILTIKNNLQGSSHQITDALGGLGSLIGSAGTNSSQTGAVLQSILLIIESLV